MPRRARATVAEARSSCRRPDVGDAGAESELLEVAWEVPAVSPRVVVHMVVSDAMLASESDDLLGSVGDVDERRADEIDNAQVVSDQNHGLVSACPGREVRRDDLLAGVAVGSSNHGAAVHPVGREQSLVRGSWELHVDVRFPP